MSEDPKPPIKKVADKVLKPRALRHGSAVLATIFALLIPFSAWLYFFHRKVFDEVSILTLAEMTFISAAQSAFSQWQSSRQEEKQDES